MCTDIHIYIPNSLLRNLCLWMNNQLSNVNEMFISSPLSQSSAILILRSRTSSLFYGSIYLQSHVVFIIILYHNIFWKFKNHLGNFEYILFYEKCYGNLDCESTVSKDKLGKNFHHYNSQSLNSQVIIHLLKPYSAAFRTHLYPSL